MHTIYVMQENARELRGYCNTCRLGTKWARRVRTGDWVRFAVTETDETIGLALVAHTATGRYRDLEAEHGPLNHAGGAESLRVALGVSYGAEFDEDATVTFVYVVFPNTGRE